MLNIILYNQDEVIKNEVNKGRRKASSISTAATSTTAPPTARPSIGNNVCGVVSNNDTLFDRKIGLIIEGIEPFFASRLKELPQENALTMVDYVISMKNEINLSDGYRRLNIYTFYSISNFFKNMKTYKELTRDDILQYLDSFRKSEASDPLHKWIGTYNINRVLFIRFFKWLYYPDIEQKKRPKPEVIENIALLKRREQSIYKPSDLWTIEDDLLFLKYCHSARERCYHTISRDLSCRPHEILKLRLKDIHFKNSGDCQYAEVLLNGKTGNRNIPLISSLPYLKDWIDQHPQSGNPNGQLICGLGKTLGRRLTTHAVYQIYKNYREKVFPKLLDNPSVPPEDIAASAKSMFLLQMQKKLEDTYYVDCTNASGPGMVEYLFKNDVKYLLLDEVEKMSKSDQNVLLNVLETGILTSTKVKKTGSKKMDISVYATTNDIDAISKPFRSRFVELSLPGYNFDEFCEIAVKLTEQRDGHDRKIAVKIADTVWNKLNSRDVRDIIQISKLTMSIDDVDFLANTLQKYKRKIEREGQDVG